MRVTSDCKVLYSAVASVDPANDAIGRPRNPRGSFGPDDADAGEDLLFLLVMLLLLLPMMVVTLLVTIRILLLLVWGW